MIDADLQSVRLTARTETASSTSADTARTSYRRRSPREAGPYGAPRSTCSRFKLRSGPARWSGTEDARGCLPAWRHHMMGKHSVSPVRAGRAP